MARIPMPVRLQRERYGRMAEPFCYNIDANIGGE
jgi:hypothetical protein